MANRYWVGGSGTWDTTTTTHWSTTSGGAGGASVPTASDNVFFDANSSPLNATITCTGALTCLSFSLSGRNFTFAVSGSASLAISGSFDYGGVAFTWSASLLVTFNATTTGNTIKVGAGGNNLSGGVTFDGIGGEWTLTDDFTSSNISSPLTVTLNNGTLRLSTYTLSTNKFFVGAGTKTLDFGTGVISVFSSSSITVWDSGTNLSGLTVTGTGYVQTSAGAACTQTIFTGAASESNAISFVLGINNFYNVTTTFTANDAIKNFSWGSGTNTLSNTALTVYGNFSGSGLMASGTNAITFASSSSQSISGSTFDCPINFSGTGTYNVGNFTTGATRTCTLTSGTLSLGSNTLNTGLFVVSGSANKSINFGTGSIQLNGTGTVWNSSAGITGFSSSGTGSVVVAGTGLKTINTGAIPESAAINFSLQALTSTTTFTTGDTVKNLTLNGSFTLSNVAITIYGNATITAVTTLTAGSNAWTFGATSGTKTLNNPWGSAWPFPLNFNGVGGTFQLASALTVNRAVAGVITLTNGTLDLNGYTLTLAAATGATFLTATGTKNITFNGGTLAIASVGTTAFNNAAPTGFTTTAGTGNGSISMAGATAKTFVGGGSTYACAINNGGAGALTISGANTFADITSTYAATTGANNTIFPSSTTTTITKNFTGTGASGRLFSLTSSTAGTQATINFSGSGSTSGADYLSLKDIAFTPFVTNGTAPYVWYGGANSKIVSNVSGILLAASTVIAYALASGTSFTTPSDWNNSNNTIHLFGGGGGGGGGRATTSTNKAGGGGGGGGGYTKLTNQTLSGTISYSIGAGGTAGASSGGTGGTGGTTTWNVTNTALGGGGGSTTAVPGSVGGLGGVGLTFTGGVGGVGSTSLSSGTATAGGGGGGAAGPNGTGGAGGAGNGVGGGGGGGNGGGTAGGSSTSGGAGGNNSLGTGGGTANGGSGSLGGGGGGSASAAVAGAAGGVGIDVLNTIGGGGGAGATTGVGVAGTSTAYGAGGSGGSTNTTTTSAAGGAGGPGLIVVVYTPAGAAANKSSFFLLL